jgi:hypothetical protein
VARVRRVVSTRAGGRSRGAFGTFNLSAGVGDDPAAVAANRARLTSELGVPVVFLQQVHGTDVVVVDAPPEDGEPDRWLAPATRASTRVDRPAPHEPNLLGTLLPIQVEHRKQWPTRHRPRVLSRSASRPEGRTWNERADQRQSSLTWAAGAATRIGARASPRCHQPARAATRG